MTILITFSPHLARSRILTWLERALILCPFKPEEVAVSAPDLEKSIEIH